MAFTSELIESSADYEITSDGRLVKKYHEKYLCHNFGGYLTLDGVVLALGIITGTAYKDYAFATARSVKPERLFHQAPYFDWHVSIEYSTDTPAFAEDPTQRPVKRRVFSSETQRAIFKDNSGNLILNAVGDPFDGGLPVNHHMPQITWERNEDAATFNIDQFNQLSGSLNVSMFAGCDVETLQLVATADETWEGKYHFWKCLYQMTYNDQGWQPQTPNAGLNQFDNSGKVVRILLDDKEPCQEPQPLYDSTGGVLVGRMIPVSARPASCTFVKAQYHPKIDFGVLNLSLV